MKEMIMYNCESDKETLSEARTRLEVARFHNYFQNELWMVWDKCCKLYDMIENECGDNYFFALFKELDKSIHNEIRRRYMMKFALMSDEEIKEYQKKEYNQHGESYEYYSCEEELDERERYTSNELFSEVLGGRTAYDEKVRKVCNLYGWDIIDKN